MRQVLLYLFSWTCITFIKFGRLTVKVISIISASRKIISIFCINLDHFFLKLRESLRKRNAKMARNQRMITNMMWNLTMKNLIFLWSTCSCIRIRRTQEAANLKLKAINQLIKSVIRTLITCLVLKNKTNKNISHQLIPQTELKPRKIWLLKIVNQKRGYRFRIYFVDPHKFKTTNFPSTMK